MDFSRLMFWRKTKTSEVHEEVPIKEAGGGGGTSGQITNANIKNFVVKAVGFIDSGGNTDFEEPEYDFEDIKKAVNGDSYIKIAIAKYSQLIFKAGYNIVSENDSAADYLRGRLRMMSFMTGKPMDMLFQETTDDLVTYSNAYWIKSRQAMSNIGGLQAKGVLGTDPVCGYYRVDPATITIKRDKNGTIKQYQQEAGDNKKTFKPEDVVHFYVDKPGGAAYGVPRIVAVMEDVKLLRKIEGNILNLIYRFAIPIYQMKIGLPEAGFRATDKEISEARKEVEKMANDGVLVTNEATEFKSIGAEGEALDATGYLNYFENRVFAGLNMSQAMMGRGGTKQDADSMEQQIHDTVKYYQFCFSTILRESVFNELLLEGGFNPIINEPDIVEFKFSEINNETRVKMDTHALNQFQGNNITFAEMRKMIGRRSDNVDMTQLYANLIQQPNAIQLVQAKNMMGGTTGQGNGTAQNGSTDPKVSSTTGTGTQTSSGGAKTNGTAGNTMQPQNQHGKTSAHIKESFTQKLTEKNDNLNKNQENYQKSFEKIYKKYNAVRNDVCSKGVFTKPQLAIAKDGIVKELNNYITAEAAKGVEKAIKDSGKKEYSLNKLSTVILTSKVEKTSKDIFNDVAKKLRRANNKQEREAAFDSLEYRVRFMTEHIVNKAYWYAYIKTCQQLGIDKVYVNFGKSEDKEKHEAIVNTNAFNIDDIPPFNAYCSCKISLDQPKKEGENKNGNGNT